MMRELGGECEFEVMGGIGMGMGMGMGLRLGEVRSGLVV